MRTGHRPAGQGAYVRAQNPSGYDPAGAERPDLYDTFRTRSSPSLHCDRYCRCSSEGLKNRQERRLYPTSDGTFRTQLFDPQRAACAKR